MVFSSLANEALILDTERKIGFIVHLKKQNKTTQAKVNKQKLWILKVLHTNKRPWNFQQNLCVHSRARYRCLKFIMNTGISSESEVTCNVGWRRIFTYLWPVWQWSHLSGSCPPTKHFLDWIIQVIALSFQHTFHV